MKRFPADCSFVSAISMAIFGSALAFGGSATAQTPDAGQQQPASAATAQPANTPPADPPSADPPSADPAQTAAPTQVRTPSAPPEGTAPADAKGEPPSEPAEKAGAITEDEVKQLVVGKTLYLRDGYLDNALSFDEHGKLVGHSPQGSYTLSLVEIDKVHLTKHKVELTGVRYGLHFLGARADEDPTKAVDKVRITPKKKLVRITVDRELVVTPKKKKGKRGEAVPQAKGEPAKDAPAQPDAPANAPANTPSDADQAKAEMNTAPVEERPANPDSVTTTTSPAHAARLLRGAIDKIFAQGLDAQMIGAMPDLWKLYYQAAAMQTDYKPADAAIFRQSNVDQKAKLLTTIEAPSNEYAQVNGVAGMALYHAVIGADGKPQDIVVGRPIGFGLDESAAETIRKASFQPAIKDGKPVAVALDVVVQFRIYSKRTDQPAKPEEAVDAAPKLPGPYSVIHP